MITMKEWMELVDYRVTEGSSYGWQCYGPYAYMMDSWNGEHDGHSFTILFDTKTQAVYEVQVHDYTNNRAYRMLNESFEQAMTTEAAARGINKTEAWDEVSYVDLEVDDDFIQKCLSIKAGEVYDTRVSVPLTLDDDQMFDLMKLAHERDITLNQLVESVLRDAIAVHESVVP
jgi:hypothetical protein